MPDERRETRPARTVRARGTVQGVGFRPFVYRLARELGLTGTVANDAQGVAVRAWGDAEALDAFVRRLADEAPQAARISAVETADLGESEAPPDFRILASSHDADAATAAIPPDLATCPDCLAEIFDPQNRRYRYPFTNCTNCGPRFTITAHIPYDRPNTAMRVFPMCPECLREYEDPEDRRFHAQPNACPVCGPRLFWCDGQGRELPGDPLAECARALASGAVVAIKGLGGFHLAVDAASSEAVARLRQRKARPEKPLAVMAADLVAARRFCRISPDEAALLEAAAHPIVLLAALPGSGLSPLLAPGLGVLGLMLAYTPLHHLLLAEPACPQALVMTSGNRSGSPICTDNDDALSRLAGIADFFLLHNRDILTRADDSVVRVMAGAPRPLRRARGYAPAPVPLSRPCADTLACGAAMKSAFCITRAGEAYMSQHIGELDNAETFSFYRESVAHLQSVLECAPARIVCDRHPDYPSSRFASEYAAEGGTRPITVQHHHAHALSVMAEHGLEDPMLALVLDGTGLGDDGSIWGGEILWVTRREYRRLGHLQKMPLPGGEAAIREPWRQGLALWLQSCPDEALPESLLAVPEAKRLLTAQLIEKRLNCPETSSAGRLFDAVSALLGLCLSSSYEGQAAMLLEQQASLARDAAKGVDWPPRIGRREGRIIIETAPMCRELLQARAAGAATPALALAFHKWLATSCRAALAEARRETGFSEIALSGGCMQNKILLELLDEGLAEDGFTVFANLAVPANDGGLALGQAYFSPPCHSEEPQATRNPPPPAGDSSLRSE